MYVVDKTGHGDKLTGVSRVDVQVASGLGRPPLLPLIHTLDEVVLSPAVISDAEIPSLNHLDSLGYGVETVKKVFSILRQAMLSRRYESVSPDSIRIILNHADHAILNHLHDECTSVDVYQFKVLIMATHVFIYAILRQLPPNGPLVGVLLTRLGDELSNKLSNIDVWGDHLSVLLWALYVGASVSSKRIGGKSAWFSARLRHVVQQLHLRTKLEVEECLQTFLWTEAYFREFLDEWWEDAGDLSPDPTVSGIASESTRGN
jgi:hypothetical protein